MAGKPAEELVPGETRFLLGSHPLHVALCLGAESYRTVLIHTGRSADSAIVQVLLRQPYCYDYSLPVMSRRYCPAAGTLLFDL